MSEASRSLFRHRDFVKLWTAETISVFGTQITLLALPLIAATTLNVTPFEFGLLGAIEFLPFILLSLPAGVWVDRLRRRPILIAGDVVRAVALPAHPDRLRARRPDDLAALHRRVHQRLRDGLLRRRLPVVPAVARRSRPDHRRQLEARDERARRRRSSGRASPGFLIGAITAPFAILVDSISFVVSALFMVAIRRHEDEAGAAGRRARRAAVDAERDRGGPPVRRAATVTCGASPRRPGRRTSSRTCSSRSCSSSSSASSRSRPELLGLAFSIGAVGFLIGALVAGRDRRAVRRRPNDRRLGVRVRPVGPAHCDRPGRTRRAVRRRQHLRRRLRQCALYNINQVSLRQAITPESNAGPDERDDAVHRLGHDPDRCDRRRLPRRGDRPSRDDLGRARSAGLFVFLPVLLSPVRSLRRIPDLGPDDAEPVAGEAS